MPVRTRGFIAVWGLALACLVSGLAPGGAAAVTLPAGFEHTTAIAGLTRPMDVEIAPNGRVFVAEKSGVVKTWTSLADTTATKAADLRTQVHNFSARGLVSLAVDPAFPAQPYIYVYYNLDARIGGIPPLYGTAGQTYDDCAKATGGKDENCIGAVRISRLRIDGETMTGPEQVLVEDYCHQYPYHVGGGLEFGADGYLYASGSDGSTAKLWDWGQTGTPANPCGDPPGAVGALLSPPTSEGGRLRVQDLRTPGDPTGLDGSLIRIDPATGAGAPGNPLASSPSANERRMLGYGLRDSMRLAVRPGTSEIWVTDRGGGYWDEFNRVQAPGSSVLNFGYPCYEGGIDAAGNPYTRIRPATDNLDLDICENLYRAGNQTVAPYWAYDHELDVVPGEPCTRDAAGAPAGTLLSGVAFYPGSGGSFPAAYRGALFFTDRLRDCMYVLLPGTNGLPAPGKVDLFAAGAMRSVDIEVAPGGDLLYVDQEQYAVQRISYTGPVTNTPPTAVASASVTSGVAPLSVAFDGSGSTDLDGDALTYEWDLDGDGQLDDSTAAKPTFTYTTPGDYTVTLRVSDNRGGSDTATVPVNVRRVTTTVQFGADADARVEASRPTTKLGTSSTLVVRGGTSLVTESYLRFQVSGITGTVESATLKLRALGNGTVDGPALYSAANGWTESTVTWATRPALGPTRIGDLGAIAANTTVEYDVKPLVSGNGAVAFGLVGTSDDGVDLASREYGTASRRPMLVVTFSG